MVRKHTRRHGAVAVLVAISLTALIAILALVVDGGMMFTERRHAQATADAAAMAAATVLYTHYPRDRGADPNNEARTAALAYAASNGYTNDGTHSTVEVYIPPATGPYAGKLGYSEVVVTYKQPRSFSTIFGSSAALAIRARAVSRGAWVVPNAGVIVLAYSGKGTLSAQGNGAFTEVGAPVIVNSSDETAAIDTGNGIMRAPEFDITGGYAITGNGQMVGTIVTGVHPTPDPLAYLPVPTPPVDAGQMDRTSLGNGNFRYDLYPGLFSNLPNFNTGDQVVFHQASSNGNDGVFYLTAGGLSSQGATLTMASGETGGIMLYNAGTGTNDKIKITGNPDGTVNLVPRTDGTYQGMTIFQARNASQAIEVAGNGSFTIKGTLYGAAALLSVTGNGTLSNIGSQYVSKDLALAGNGNVGISFDPQNVAPTRIITLVE
ncbi:MAG: hypothetical protein K2R98_26970 [Gemmataceae bacterium]|nr:hypothetical protein [Gemmataceae bacterium]